MASGPDYSSDGTTVVEILQALEAAGYAGDFGAREEATVICFTCRKETPARDVPLEKLRRTEGASDPDDMVAVAAIVCPQCGTKGTLVLHFGAEATPAEDEVLHDLEDKRER